ncbi:MAG: class I SAM-dependent methyltransferase [Chitinophagaceae bacterium]|nr:class I SAM-dependent methyltransferase [Chitinophagaceae bacterium]
MACTNCDFIRNEDFVRAYNAGKATDSWQGGEIHWRVHVILWAAECGLKLGGDFVECGVNRGGYSRAIFEYLDMKTFGDRKFFLLDTYEGFSEKYLSEQEKARGKSFGGYEDSYEIVKNTFAEFKNAIIIKGPVPDTLPYVTSDKISYLSIDMNCVEPEIAAAEFFWDKLVSGAVMVIDDYGWAEHLPQKTAFDDFAKRKLVTILSLPTGQGILIKP